MTMVRRTQAQRSASTRAALLDATIACLVERGFEGTSTPEICRRAGVSRGAQLHHYPTKEELLAASVEHLCERRLEEFQQMVQADSSPAGRVESAFDKLWEIYSGPTLMAWVELAVAARTNPALQEHMHRVSGRVEDEAEAALREYFGIADHVPARASVHMVLSLLDGLALRTILQGDASAREALTVFRALVEPWLGAR